MTGRDPHEAHRASTPLELLFDLVFVVAIALAAAQLHHGIAENHAGTAIIQFVMVFFAIWWAWMGFSWFASAFDTDDIPYRLTVMVQMTGALVIAAGIPSVFKSNDWRIIVLGYIIMRLGSVTQWLRAAKQAPAHRAAALRYAVGITLCQAGWAGSLALPLPKDYSLIIFAIMVAAELLVPAWAEAKKATRTPWHTHHITERFSLMTIIVLGESILSSSMALQNAMDLHTINSKLLVLVASAIMMIFSMWWLYFDNTERNLQKNNPISFSWSYGHYVIFAAAAAVGAGLAASVDYLTHKTHISAFAADAAVAIPTALYLLGLWFCHEIKCSKHLRDILPFPLASALILITPFTPYAIPCCALLLASLLTWRLNQNCQNDAKGRLA